MKIKHANGMRSIRTYELQRHEAFALLLISTKKCSSKARGGTLSAWEPATSKRSVPNGKTAPIPDLRFFALSTVKRSHKETVSGLLGR